MSSQTCTFALPSTPSAAKRRKRSRTDQTELGSTRGTRSRTPRPGSSAENTASHRGSATRALRPTKINGRADNDNDIEDTSLPAGTTSRATVDTGVSASTTTTSHGMVSPNSAGTIAPADADNDENDIDTVYGDMIRSLASKSLKLFVKDLKSSGRKTSRARAPSVTAQASTRRQQEVQAVTPLPAGIITRPATKTRRASAAKSPVTVQPTESTRAPACFSAFASQVPPTLRWACRTALCTWCSMATTTSHDHMLAPGARDRAHGDDINQEACGGDDGDQSHSTAPDDGEQAATAYCNALEEALYETYRTRGSNYIEGVSRVGHIIATRGLVEVSQRYTPIELAHADERELAADTPEAIEYRRASAAAAECRALMSTRIFADVEQQNRRRMVPCSSCRGTDVAGTPRQIRSADEGMTWFFKCRTCHHKWKV